MDKHTDLILRLQDEADLCRNDGASDIAALLDEAVEALRDRNHDTAVGERWRIDSRLEEWFPLTAERLAALEAENAALKREAYTWWTAARDAHAPAAPAAQAEPNPDDQDVDTFASLLKAKLAKARAKGRSGWRDPSWPAADINRQMHEHAAKGDPLDVAAYAMFLALRGEATTGAAAQAEQAPIETSPEFTDTARAALLWVLWHHQGGSSPIGQPIRFALGMGAHEPLSEHQVREAKRWAALSKSTTADFHAHRTAPASRGEQPAQVVALTTGFDLTLDDAALELLHAFVAPVDGDFGGVRLLWGDGHSGPGLYLSHPEHPEEGSVLLAAAPEGAAS